MSTIMQIAMKPMMAASKLPNRLSHGFGTLYVNPGIVAPPMVYPGSMIVVAKTLLST